MKRFAIFLMVLWFCGSAFADETWYVNTDVGSSGDGTSGSPYKYLTNFVAGKGASLADRGKVICYVSGATNDTTAVDLASFTDADATDHLEIICSDPWQGSFDDLKYYLVSSAGYTYTMSNIPAYTVLRGLQLRMSDGNSSSVGLRANVYLDRCLMINSGKYGVYLLSAGGIVNNCLIEASANHGITGGQNVTVMNTTITGSGGGGFYVDGYVTWTIRNCVSAGNTGDDYYRNNATLNLTNCLSEDGTRSTSTITYDTDTFVNISTGTSADRRLVAGSGLIGTGADMSSYSTASAPTGVDIEGDDRPQGDTWDVGYDEFAEEETGPTATQRWWGRRRQ